MPIDMENFMEQFFVIRETLTRQEEVFVSAAMLLRSFLGKMSLYLIAFMLLFWTLFEFKESSFFIAIILSALFPWALFVIRKIISLCIKPKAKDCIVEFSADCIELRIKRNEIDLAWKIPYNTIQNIVYLKKYIIIITPQNLSLPIKRSSIPDDQKWLFEKLSNRSPRINAKRSFISTAPGNQATWDVDMFKTFIIKDIFYSKNTIISSVQEFLYKQIELASFFLSLLFLGLLVVYFEIYIHVAGIFVLLVLWPWFYILSVYIIYLTGKNKFKFNEIEFTPDHLKFIKCLEDSKINMTVPRTIITKGKYTDRYLYIYTKYDDCITKDIGWHSEEEAGMLENYFNPMNSIEQ
jgi:hypothetical protein